MKVKTFIKNNIIGFILGAIIFGTGGVIAVTSILSNEVAYDNSSGYTDATTMKGALDELYGLAVEKGLIEPPPQYLADYLKNTVYGTENSYLYHHLNDANGYGEQSIDGWAAQNAGDGSYRYSGPDASVNNYICFGTTDKNTCLNDTSNGADSSTGTSKYLYRIMGVFGDNVKILMANPLYNTKISQSYFFREHPRYNTNIWESSSLKQWLNGETLMLNGETLKSGAEALYPDTTFMSLYPEANGINWSNKLDTYNWVVGGYEISSIKVKEFYDYEESGRCYNTSTREANTGVCSPVRAKVGLMRASDYGYAASPSYWNTTNLGSYSSITDYNWLFRSTNSSEWTMGSSSYDSYDALNIYNGNIGFKGSNNARAVRPSMYLSSTTQYISGDGSSDNPYIIG